jgi:tetratricopeptide (TPR) repeat protein
MKKQIAIVLFLALMTSLLTVVAVAQPASSVKGYCKDEAGAPIVGGVVEFTNLDNGRKVKITTDKKGEYFSMGVGIGAYKVALSDASGKLIFTFPKFNVTMDPEANTVNFDMAKERKAAGMAPMTEEQKKAKEKVDKENSNIKNLNAMLAQAKAAREAGNWDESISIMEKATQVDGTKDLLWAVLGDSYIGAKKWPEAAGAYKKAIAIAPKGEYHNNLGQALAKSGNAADAIKEYDTAAQLDPTNAGMYYFNEGAVLTNTGKPDEANAAFDKAIAADPTKADAYYQKGVNLLSKATYDKSGNMVPAPGTADAFNKYLELAPNGSLAPQAKEMLTALGSKVETSFGTEKKKSGKK